MADDWLDKFRAMAGAYADPDAWLLEQIEQLGQALQDGDMQAVKLHAGRVALQSSLPCRAAEGVGDPCREAAVGAAVRARSWDP